MGPGDNRDANAKNVNNVLVWWHCLNLHENKCQRNQRHSSSPPPFPPSSHTETLSDYVFIHCPICQTFWNPAGSNIAQDNDKTITSFGTRNIKKTRTFRLISMCRMPQWSGGRWAFHHKNLSNILCSADLHANSMISQELYDISASIYPMPI